MAVSDALKKMRSGDESQSVRVIKLSEEEAKALDPVPDGQEVQCDVMAKKEGDHLHVMSVKYTGGEGTMPDQDMNEMAAKVAGVQAPMMRSQVAPSPS
jgi:hypothetical protein